MKNCEDNLREALHLLECVYNYSKGIGNYDLSVYSGQERDVRTMELWEDLEADIFKVMSKHDILG